MMFAICIVKIVVVTVFMLSLSPTLTLIVFATVIPMMTILFWLRSALRKMYTAQRAKNSNRTAFLVESIMGKQIVRTIIALILIRISTGRYMRIVCLCGGAL